MLGKLDKMTRPAATRAELDAARTKKDENASAASPSFTPALTTSSHDTPSVAADDPFLSTPTAAQDISRLSSSFIFPSRSFEMEVSRYTNLQEVLPDWDDDEVDEIMILSSKPKLPKTLSVVLESQETRTSQQLPSTSSFTHVRSLGSLPPSLRVCLKRHAPTGSLYAVKTFLKSSISYDTPTLEQAMKEQMMLRLLTQMDVLFVLKLRWSFQDGESMHLVTDFCEHGDLKSHIERDGPLQASPAIVIAAELTDALCSLHGSGITHRSIRPEHILLDSAGHVLLTGFSRSWVCSSNSPGAGNISFTSGSSDRCQANELDEWSAPETVLAWAQDYAVDCWAFGLVLAYILTGKHPMLCGIQDAENGRPSVRVLESVILHAPLQLKAAEAGVKELITWCLQRNSRLRASAEDIRTHSYFEDIDWANLRDKRYPVNLSSSPEAKAASPPGEELFDLPESETLRGVHIAGFNFAYEEAQEPSRADLSEGEFTDLTVESVAQEKSDCEKSPSDAVCASVQVKPEEAKKQAEHEEIITAPSSRRTTFTGPGSNYVTPLGSIASDKDSAASWAGSVPSRSTALYSCTSFGELRDYLTTGTMDIHDNDGDADSNLQSNAAEQLTSRKMPISSDLVSASVPVTAIDDHERRGTEPARPSSILMRRDTVNTLLSTSTVGSSRPESSLGGARGGMRVRKYASLNFDLDTIVSLDLDFDRENSNVTESESRRPRSLATSRRVSFVDSLNADMSNAPISVSAPGHSPLKPHEFRTVPHTAPIGATSTPWSLKNLNHFKLASPSQAGSNLPGAAVNVNKLKKKQRASSTPVLSPRAQQEMKTDLPAGVQQIGLGIGYTYTRPAGAPSPPLPSHDQQGQAQAQDKLVDGRGVSSAGTVSAIQRCSAIFANLALGRHNSTKAQNKANNKPSQVDCPGGQERARASEESDALEAVMKEMYGASWSADSGSGYHGGGGLSTAVGGATRMGGIGARKLGRVYSVPGMSGYTGSVARNTQAGSSTLRLVGQAGEHEFQS